MHIVCLNKQSNKLWRVYSNSEKTLNNNYTPWEILVLRQKIWKVGHNSRDIGLIKAESIKNDALFSSI